MNIEYIPTFSYFSNFISSWDRKILDFGSNNGNLIRSSNGIIREEQYTGIDVDLDSIMNGKHNFPGAIWMQYDRYNPVYNPIGLEILPEIDSEFDYILSYSVFTHMTIIDTIDIITCLMSKNLKKNGKMFFTFCNIDNKKCVDWFRNRREECDELPDEEIVYLVDNKIGYGYPSGKCNHFVSFYKPEYLLSKFSRYNPKIYKSPEGWFQDCIELQLGVKSEVVRGVCL